MGSFESSSQGLSGDHLDNGWEDVDVAIVGGQCPISSSYPQSDLQLLGGPTGLFSGLLLRRLGVTVRVLGADLKLHTIL